MIQYNDLIRRLFRTLIFILISYLICKYYLNLNDREALTVASFHSSLYMGLDTIYPRIHYESKE
jgi:hypothetical protein